MGFERLLHIPPKKTEVKAIKCLEVHAVKQTEKQYSFIVRRFHKETANFLRKSALGRSIHGTDVSLQRPTRDILLIFYFRCMVIVLA